MLQWFLRDEVALHNLPGDTWVSLFGLVYDVSDIAHQTCSTSASRVISAHAGKDISHLFDPDTKEVRTALGSVSLKILYPPHVNASLGFRFKVMSCIHPVSGERVVLVPVSERNATPWWREDYRITGRLTRRGRPIRLIDTFSGLQALIKVCSEDSVRRILQRYSIYNSKVFDYDCTVDGIRLDIDKTLEENGIVDEREMFEEMRLPEDFYIPAILLHLPSFMHQHYKS